MALEIDKGTNIDSGWASQIVWRGGTGQPYNTINARNVSVFPTYIPGGITGATPPIYARPNFIIELKDNSGNLLLRFSLGEVSNQTTWTETLAGLTQAVDDITTWIAEAITSTSGGTTQYAQASTFNTGDLGVLMLAVDGAGKYAQLTLDSSLDLTALRVVDYPLNNMLGTLWGNDNESSTLSGFNSLGKAVNPSTYAPAYAPNDAAMFAFDKDSGRLLVSTQSSTTNFGAAASADRVAALLGNASGIADFNTGNSSAQTLRVVLATDQPTVSVSGNVGGYTFRQNTIQTVTASSAYSAGQCVGGKITLTNAVRSTGTGVWQSLMISDKSNQKPPLEILIFDADPTTATITDKTSFAFGSDLPRLLHRQTVASTDYVTINGVAVASLGGLSRVVKAQSGTSLYMAVVTTGTPTFASTSDITVSTGILQD